MRTHRKKLTSGTQDRWCNMDDSDVKEQALKQAQEAYIIFHKFLKYFGYTMLFLIFLLYLNDFFNDPTASRHLPEEIADQYDPKGLNKRKGI